MVLYLIIDALAGDQMWVHQGLPVMSPDSLLARVASASFGLKLATSMCSEKPTKMDPETCSSVLRLLFEELLCMPGISHSIHLDVLVGFYALNGDHRDFDRSSFFLYFDPHVLNYIPEVEHIMDTNITQASKKLSAEDFSHLLDVLAEGIGGNGLQVSYRERLIHLGKVILHDAPRGRLDPMSKGFVLLTSVHRYAQGRSKLCDAMLRLVCESRGDLREFILPKNAIFGLYCETLFR